MINKLLLLAFLTVVSYHCFSQQFSSSNLPVIVINTSGQEIPDDPKITADLGIIFNGEGQRNNISDAFNLYNGKAGIEVRGQSSQMFPMKSYSIELWDNAGKSINKSLFGLPAESDWVLYAPYNDKTLMHNFLAYTICRQMGRWAANCRYVELVLNGEYKGIYVLMEKIKRNSGRVSVSKMGSGDITADNVTGGYIFSIDKEADGWYSSYLAGNTGTGVIQFSYVYPKLSSIAEEQKAYIKSYVDSFEKSLAATDYQDKINGWRKFADEPSFIDYFIVNEISRNVDGYRLSSYFYKDRNSINRKIFAGPAWDYDLAFRNADYCDGSNTNGWSWEFNNVCPTDYWQVPFWWKKFAADTSFQNNLLCRWKALRQTVLSKQHLYRLIDSVVTLTTEARQRHFTQWPVLGQYIWPNPSPIPATYQEEISTLKSWLEKRLQWIDSNLVNKGGCASFPSNVTASAILKIYPNPVGSNTTIVIQSAINQQVILQVFDMQGKKIYSNNFVLQPGTNNITANTASWPRGLFTATIITSKGELIRSRILK